MLDTPLPSAPTGYRPVEQPEPPSAAPGAVRSVLATGLTAAAVLAPTGWLPSVVHALLGAAAAVLLPGAVVLGVPALADRLRRVGGLERTGLTVLASLLCWIVAGLLAYVCTARATTLATTITLAVLLLIATCAAADPLRGLRAPASATAPLVALLGLGAVITAAVLIGPALPAPASTGTVAIALDGGQATGAVVSGGLEPPPVGVQLQVKLQVSNPAAQDRTFTVTASMPWGTKWSPRTVTVPAHGSAPVSVYGLVPQAKCTTDVTIGLRDADGNRVTGGLTVPVLARAVDGPCPDPSAGADTPSADLNSTGMPADGGSLPGAAGADGTGSSAAHPGTAGTATPPVAGSTPATTAPVPSAGAGSGAGTSAGPVPVTSVPATGNPYAGLLGSTTPAG